MDEDNKTTWIEVSIKCPICSEETKFRYYEYLIQVLFESEGLSPAWLTLRDSATKTLCMDCGASEVVIPRELLKKR